MGGFLLSPVKLEKMAARRPPPLIFIETHETAEAEVSNIVHRLGDWRNLSFMIPRNFVSMGFPGPFPGPYMPLAHRQFDIIANHATLDLRRMSTYLRQRKPLVFSVLLDPVRQFENAYNKYKQHRQVPVGDHLEWMRALTYVTTTAAALFRNPQAHDLGWYKHVAYSTSKDHDENAITEWIETVLTPQVDLILIAERLDEGLVVLKEAMNGTVAIEELVTVPLREHKPGQRHVGLTHTQEQRVLRINHVDHVLYRHFARKFDRIAAHMSANARENLDKLRTLKQQYEGKCKGLPRWGSGRGAVRPKVRYVAKEKQCPLALRTDANGYTRHHATRQQG